MHARRRRRDQELHPQWHDHSTVRNVGGDLDRTKHQSAGTDGDIIRDLRTKQHRPVADPHPVADLQRPVKDNAIAYFAIGADAARRKRQFVQTRIAADLRPTANGDRRSIGAMQTASVTDAD